MGKREGLCSQAHSLIEVGRTVISYDQLKVPFSKGMTTKQVWHCSKGILHDAGEKKKLPTTVFHVYILSTEIFRAVRKIVLILVSSKPDLCKQWWTIHTISLSSEAAEVCVAGVKVTTLLMTSLMPWNKF